MKRTVAKKKERDASPMELITFLLESLQAAEAERDALREKVKKAKEVLDS
jgi:hypothetical protein